MKSIQDLVYQIADKDKDDPVRHGLITLTVDEMQRFHDAAIAQYRESLLAGVGEPYYPQWSHSNEFAAYTADQMAAAVAIERERCAKVCEETVAHHYMKQTIPAKDEALLLAGCADCAAAIRGQR